MKLNYPVFKQLFTPAACISPVAVGYPSGYEYRNPGSHQNDTVKERLIDYEGLRSTSEICPETKAIKVADKKAY